MKYFDPDQGAWTEMRPGGGRDQLQQDSDALSMSSASGIGSPAEPHSGVVHRPLCRSRSTGSRHSLKSNGTTEGGTSGVVRLTRAGGRQRKRVVLKNGTVNLQKAHVSKRKQRFLQDIFTTMVDIQWRYNLMVFALGFLLSWIGFALIWWLICLSHGDFEHVGDDDWTPCVSEVHDFATAFLFSVETQHTIGYGSRCTSAECPEAIFIMCVQSITGVMIQCFMAGIVFAKLSRPKNRSQTLMFSRYACVCLRDSRLCFMFRVGDMRKSHIIGATVSALLIRRKTTQEGEVIPYYHTLLDVRFDNGGDSVFLIWPATIVHEINESSPFFLKSAEDMLRERYEVVVFLEGTIESTGQSIQARSSYIAMEVLWGHRFDQVVSFRKETGEYLVDYSKFNATNEVQTPLCSARDFAEYQRLLLESKQSTPPLAPTTDHNSTSTNEDSRDSYKRSFSSPNGVPVEQNMSLGQNTMDTPINLGQVNNTPGTFGHNTMNSPNNLRHNTVNTPIHLEQPVGSMPMNLEQSTVEKPKNIGQPTIAMSMSIRQPLADTPLDLKHPTVDTPLLRDMSNTSDC